MLFEVLNSRILFILHHLVEIIQHARLYFSKITEMDKIIVNLLDN